MALRNLIRIDEELCDGCGECVPSCADGALQVIDGKARLLSDVLCDGLGACLGECPTGALTVIQREAVEFDEAGVTPQHQAASVRAPSGCPSSSVRVIPLVETARRPAVDAAAGPGGSQGVQQWPVQLHLVPPSAPFFRKVFS